MEEAERELSEGRLLIQTHEAKIKSLQESVRDSEAKKRQLEESLDAINEEVARLRTAGTENARRRAGRVGWKTWPMA